MPDGNELPFPLHFYIHTSQGFCCKSKYGPTINVQREMRVAALKYGKEILGTVKKVSKLILSIKIFFKCCFLFIFNETGSIFIKF
jgi:hypothetical protein